MSGSESKTYAVRFDLSEARRTKANKDPFPHQSTAMGKLRTWCDARPNPAGGIVVLPTGGGKTFTAIRFLCSTVIPKDYKVLWLAHTHHLLEQAFDGFPESVPVIPAPKQTLLVRVVSGTTGHYKVHEIQPSDDVVIATLQTITRAFEEKQTRLHDFLATSKDRLCVIFDEAHHAPAPSYRKLLQRLREQHKEMLLIGLTATPTYHDEKKKGWLKELFPQGIIHETKASDLLAAKILAKPNFEKVPTDFTPEFNEHEYREWVETYRDLPEKIIESLAKNQERNKRIVECYLVNQKRYGKTIIFADRWYQCEYLAERLREREVRADCVYSQVDASGATAEGRNLKKATTNQEVLAKFKNNELDVILNVRMLTEGTDVPATQTVFITRQTTSSIALTQMVGRALRGPATGGTDNAFIVSFEDSWRQKINWAGFDQLESGMADDDATKVVNRPPVHLISIDLLRRLVSQMDSSLNVMTQPFLSVLPIGWYRTELQVRAKDGDDIETITPWVLVFNEQESGFYDFLKHLDTADLTPFLPESLTTDDPGIRETLDQWTERFFPKTEDAIKEVDSKDLLLIARHMAQNEGERPLWIPFEERDEYDVDRLARQILDEKLSMRAAFEKLKSAYDHPNGFLRSIFPSFAHFKTQVDACTNRLLGVGLAAEAPAVSTPLPPPALLEPPTDVKKAVRNRDKQCLCCGSTKRLQIDHINPKYLDGDHSVENLQTLCSVCNKRKGVRRISFLAKSPSQFPVDPILDLGVLTKDQAESSEPEYWERTLRRAVIFFFGSSAVSYVSIGKKGIPFHDWRVELHEDQGLDPERLQPHLAEVVESIRAIRNQKCPAGIRILGRDDTEAAYFIKGRAGSPYFNGIPNGPRCLLEVGPHIYEGVVLDGRLKIGNDQPYDSLGEASEWLGGNKGTAWKDWWMREPGAPEWRRANVVRDEFRKESAVDE